MTPKTDLTLPLLSMCLALSQARLAVTPGSGGTDILGHSCLSRAHTFIIEGVEFFLALVPISFSIFFSPLKFLGVLL